MHYPGLDGQSSRQVAGNQLRGVLQENEDGSSRAKIGQTGDSHRQERHEAQAEPGHHAESDCSPPDVPFSRRADQAPFFRCSSRPAIQPAGRLQCRDPDSINSR